MNSSAFQMPNQYSRVAKQADSQVGKDFNYKQRYYYPSNHFTLPATNKNQDSQLQTKHQLSQLQTKNRANINEPKIIQHTYNPHYQSHKQTSYYNNTNYLDRSNNNANQYDLERAIQQNFRQTAPNKNLNPNPTNELPNIANQPLNVNKQISIKPQLSSVQQQPQNNHNPVPFYCRTWFLCIIAFVVFISLAGGIYYIICTSKNNEYLSYQERLKNVESKGVSSESSLRQQQTIATINPINSEKNEQKLTQQKQYNDPVLGNQGEQMYLPQDMNNMKDKKGGNSQLEYSAQGQQQTSSQEKTTVSQKLSQRQNYEGQKVDNNSKDLIQQKQKLKINQNSSEEAAVADQQIEGLDIGNKGLEVGGDNQFDRNRQTQHRHKLRSIQSDHKQEDLHYVQTRSHNY